MAITTKNKDDSKDLGMPTGNVRGALHFGKITHSTSKYIKDKKKQEEFKNSHTFALSSYNWSDDYEPRDKTETYNPIQKMIITEFQPDFLFRWSGGALNDLGSVPLVKGLMSMAGNISKMAGVKATMKKAGYAGSNLVQGIYQDNPDKVTGMPMDFIKQLFEGKYLNVYEVPFFNETYISANTSGSWSGAGAAASIGDDFAKLFKENMSVDMPTTPVWSTPGSTDKGELAIEFYLINDNDTNLANNFKFLNSFISGAFWVQMDYVQKSPNVYDIEVPGRFHSYFAAMGVKVTQEGKLRTCSSISEKFNFNSVNKDTLFPDVYKVVVTINDLTPNNFNNYVDYLMNGSSGKVSIGTQVEAYNHINGMKDAGVEGIKKLIKEAGKLGKTK